MRHGKPRKNQMPGAEAGHEVSQLALGRLKVCSGVFAALIHHIVRNTLPLIKGAHSGALNSADVHEDKRTRADAHFRAREILRADADRARRDYYAAQAAVLDRTEWLRKERLARHAHPARRT